MIGRNLYAGSTKFVVKKPGAWKRMAVLLRRVELPLPRRFQSEPRKVCARTMRGEVGVSNCAIRTRINPNNDTHCTVDGVAGALGNIRHIAVAHVAA